MVIYFTTSWRCLTSFGLILENFNWGKGKIQTKYEHIDHASQLSIQRKLVTIKLWEGHLITIFLKDFQKVLDEVASPNLIISDKQSIILLLAN
jgi:hypothetical protein